MGELRKAYRPKDVCELFSVSHSMLYRQIAAGKFPRPNVQIGERTVGWTEDVLEAEQARRIAERIELSRRFNEWDGVALEREARRRA